MTGIRRMEIAEIAEPVIKAAGDVLVKIEAVGVCGSDVHYYETGKIGSQVVEYPFIVGHECAGTVEAVGSGVDNVKAGNRVVIEPAISCHQCDQCLAGRANTCRNLKFLGCPGQIAGCLCEYLIMPQECCFPVNESFSFGRGVLCEPCAIGVYAAQQADIGSDSDAVILGAGPIGLSCLATAGFMGARSCYVTDRIDERVEIAEKGGATWAGNPDRDDITAEILRQQAGGMDVVFECAGEQETIDQAIELLKPGGRLMLIGIPRQDRVSFIIDKMRRKEITVVNVRRQNKCTRQCIDLISSGRIDVDFMLTHRFKLEQSREAFDLVAGYRDGVIKAVIEF